MTNFVKFPVDERVRHFFPEEVVNDAHQPCFSWREDVEFSPMWSVEIRTSSLMPPENILAFFAEKSGMRFKKDPHANKKPTGGQVNIYT